MKKEYPKLDLMTEKEIGRIDMPEYKKVFLDNMETTFEGIEKRRLENLEYFGRPLTRWQRFRNWLASVLGMKKPFRDPTQWSPDELAAIASRQEYDRASLDLDPEKMKIRRDV